MPSKYIYSPWRGSSEWRNNLTKPDQQKFHWKWNRTWLLLKIKIHLLMKWNCVTSEYYSFDRRWICKKCKRRWRSMCRNDKLNPITSELCRYIEALNHFLLMLPLRRASVDCVTHNETFGIDAEDVTTHYFFRSMIISNFTHFMYLFLRLCSYGYVF